MSYDKEKVAKWINTYWTGPKKCPICQDQKWVLLDNVWELRKYQDGTLVVGGPVLPVVVMMCNVCGHSILFNAIAIGALEKENER
jgi:hypothetical protein